MTGLSAVFSTAHITTEGGVAMLGSAQSGPLLSASESAGQPSPALLCYAPVGAVCAASHLAKRYQKAWGHAELQELCEIWAAGDVEAFCAKHGRNYKTVARKASLLGLKRDPDVATRNRINSQRNKELNRRLAEEGGERKVLRNADVNLAMVARAMARRTPLELAWGGHLA